MYLKKKFITNIIFIETKKKHIQQYFKNSYKLLKLFNNLCITFIYG